ncbi:MAG: CDP-alcohol phosphatidyltransferase family protein [Gammaproteobacteria bacterium]
MTGPAQHEHQSAKEVPPPKTYVHYAGRWLILPLVNTPVTPNHLTTLRLLTGIAAAVAFAMGDYIWTAWGGVLYAISALLDRADGELARLSGKMSSWGHWFDLYADSLVNVVLFIGIGIGLTDSVLGHWAWKMGLLSGLSIAVTFWIVFRLHESGSHPSEAFNYPDGFDLDDSLFLVCIFAWFDGLLPLLIAASVCAPLFLIFALWQYYSLKSSTRT